VWAQAMILAYDQIAEHDETEMKIKLAGGSE
jgi:hypothetical protein